MRDPWSSYFRLGIVHFMAYPETIRGEGPILESLEAICRDDDFEAVEVTWMTDDAVRAQARAMLENYGVSVCYGAQPRQLIPQLDLNSSDDAARRECIDSLKTGIDEARDLGAVGFAFMSGKNAPDAERPAALERLTEAVEEVLAHAGPDLPCVLETFDYDIDKCSLVGPNAEAAEWARVIRRSHPNFGLLVDLSHLPLQHETIDHALESTADVLGHVHVGNCAFRDDGHPARGDNHPRFGCPGGENDVAELAAFLRKLLEIGYLGGDDRPIISFEVKPMAGESAEVVIAHSKRTLRAAWAAI